jgi:hypothetical protein
VGLKREPGTGPWSVPFDHAQLSCPRPASANFLRFLPLDGEEQKALDLSKKSLQGCTGGRDNLRKCDVAVLFKLFR